MAKKTFAKICKGSFDPASPYGCAVTRVAGKACHAVTLCKGGMVTGACPAVALCEGGKNAPFSRSKREYFDSFEDF